MAYKQKNYFEFRDSLASGDPDKIIKGKHFDEEFGAIEEAFGEVKVDVNAEDVIGLDTLLNEKADQSALEQEIEDRIKGDKDLQDQIDNLESYDDSQIKQDLSDLDDKIDKEIGDRGEADKLLQGQIDGLDKDKADLSALNQEIKDREDGDDAINKRIDELVTDDLADVNSANANKDDFLIHNGTQWVAKEFYIETELTYMGAISVVSDPAPAANNGDLYINNEEGEVGSSWTGIEGTQINEAVAVGWSEKNGRWYILGDIASSAVQRVEAGLGIDVDNVTEPSEPVVSIDRTETDKWYAPIDSVIDDGAVDGEVLTWDDGRGEWTPDDTLIIKGGNVGLNIDTPQQALHVKDSSRNSCQVRVEADGSATASLQLKNATGQYNVGCYGEDFQVSDVSVNQPRLIINATGDANFTGNVGVGTAPDSSRSLHVKGTNQNPVKIETSSTTRCYASFSDANTTSDQTVSVGAEADALRMTGGTLGFKRVNEIGYDFSIDSTGDVTFSGNVDVGNTRIENYGGKFYRTDNGGGFGINTVGSIYPVDTAGVSSGGTADIGTSGNMFRAGYFSSSVVANGGAEIASDTNAGINVGGGANVSTVTVQCTAAAGGSNPVWQGYKGSVNTSYIKASGAAYFAGKVGIGMAPLRSTAKEQLAEWKSRFDARLKTEPKANKKAVTLEITDNAFEVLPTEAKLAEWMESRAAGDALQVVGRGSFSGNVRCATLIAENSNSTASLQIKGDSENLYGSPNGRIWRDQGGGFQLTGTSIRPLNGIGVEEDALLDIGRTAYRFKDAHFSGTVNATTINGKVTDVPDHVKSITPTQIADWDAGTGNGEGGGATTDGRITDDQIIHWDQAYSWGDHSQANYQPAGNYVTAGTSYTKNESDNKYELKGTAYSKSESDVKYQLKGNYADADFVPSGTRSGDTLQWQQGNGWVISQKFSVDDLANATDFATKSFDVRGDGSGSQATFHIATQVNGDFTASNIKKYGGTANQLLCADGSVASRNQIVTQAEYDGLTPDADTVYFIV